jgi:hypothetical protein
MPNENCKQMHLQHKWNSYEQFLYIILLQEESLKSPNQLQDLLQHKTLQWVLFHTDLISESWELT